MEIVKRIQSFGKTITYAAPGGPHVIEAVDAGQLRVANDLILLDAFWPLDDRTEAAPRVTTGPVTLSIMLSAFEIDFPSPAMPRRYLVGGITATVEGAAPPVLWEQMRTAEGRPGGVAVDNKSIVLLDGRRVDAYRSDRDGRDESDLYEVLMRDGLAHLEGAVVVRCGEGDGVYPVMLGYAREGELAQIVVDLDLLAKGVIA